MRFYFLAVVGFAATGLASTEATSLASELKHQFEAAWNTSVWLMLVLAWPERLCQFVAAWKRTFGHR